MTGLAPIEHIVVLMLENRSFDSMLGKLYPKTPGFDGLDGSESNLDAAGNIIRVANRPGTDPAAMSVPDPDPGELFTDINTQLFGNAAVPVPTPVPSMNGFVRNYMTQDAAHSAYDPGSIMNYYTPEQVPVLSRLARQFAVCDRWFASAPCQTWPNRFFAHTGTANGYENNDPPHFPYFMETIFNRLEQAGMENPWKIYYHDFAQTWALSKLWPLIDHFRFYEEFQSDAKSGSLPAYSFIEPRYYPHASQLPNDQHPPHVVTLGEQLIADVYNCLRGGPQWQKTLLIITYDEHGGCFDHVPPPAALSPSAQATAPFNFDRYGVRVPAVLVSPYIQQGTVLRPPGTVPFDHTSVLSTLRKCFPEIGAPLTLRDAAAPDLSSALTLPLPTNMGPSSVTALPFTPTPALVARAQAAPLNGMQKALVKLAAHFPGAAPADDAAAFVANHTASLAGGAAPRPVPPTVDVTTAAGASAFIKSQVAPFIGTFSAAPSTIFPVIDDTKFTGSDTGIAVPVRRLTAGAGSISISQLDRADPPAPYHPGGVPRLATFNANVLAISANPAMPSITVNCNLQGIDPTTHPIHWRLQTLYVVGRYQKISPAPTPHYRSRVVSLPDEWTGTSRNSQFRLFAPDANVIYDNPSDRVAGGDAILTIAVQDPASNQWLQDYVHVRIGGTNPGEANVRQYVAQILAARDPNILHMANAVFTHEDNMTQFDTAFRTHERYHGVDFIWPSDPANFPSVAFDFGIGLGQFTHPGQETVSICWDWRENLKAGVNELLEDLRSTFAANLSWRDWAKRAWSTYNAGSPTSSAGLAYAATLQALPDGQLIAMANLPAGFDHMGQTAAIPVAPFPPPAAPWPVAAMV